MPLTVPCEFCGPNVSSSTDNFIKIEPKSTICHFSYELYRNLFRRFGFRYDLCEEYNEVRENTPYTDQIEESVWGLSYVFRDYYKVRFCKLFPYISNAGQQQYYNFYIKSFGKQLFREHVCAYKFLVFCGFLSELGAFCHRRAVEHTLNNTAGYLQIFFNKYISTEFYAQVGWHKLQRTAEVVSVGYKRIKNIIDSDPKIEKHSYIKEQIMNSLRVHQLKDPWIVQTAKYLCLLNEDLDIFHISSADADAEFQERSLKLNVDDSKIQPGSERNFNVQDAECQSVLMENVLTDFKIERKVRPTELNLQIADCPKISMIVKKESDIQTEETNIQENYTTATGAQDVEETLLYFAEYIQEEPQNKEVQGTVPSFREVEDSSVLDESKTLNDDLNRQLMEYIEEIRNDLKRKRNATSLI